VRVEGVTSGSPQGRLMLKLTSARKSINAVSGDRASG
jgi:hypothetical protein